MIAALAAAAAGLLVGYATGVVVEWQRVLDYLDRHLHRDVDWVRSGVAADEHHGRRNRR